MDPQTLTATKEKGGKNFCPKFFSNHKYHKITNYFIFELAKEKNLGQFCSTFYSKKLSLSSKIWVWDQGSGKPIPDPESRSQKGTGSLIRNTVNY
jgi:hypothetical protein